jgi:hypothetical protein
MEIRKRSLQHVLEAVEERVLNAEVDRLLAQSEAELDRELELAGLNPVEVRAGASEIVEKVMRLQGEGLAKATWAQPPQAPEAHHVPLAPRSRQGVVPRHWLAVWLATAALTATVMLLVAMSAVKIVRVLP